MYLYYQKQEVLFFENTDTTAIVRWRPVYAKDLKIIRGVENTILFRCFNPDQKPVDLTGETIVFRLISREDVLLLEKELTNDSVLQGRCSLTVTTKETDAIPAQRCGFSLTRKVAVLDDLDAPTGEFVYEPLFVDEEAGGRGEMDVLDSTYPKFAPSKEITIPDLGTMGNVTTTSAFQGYQTGLMTVQLTLNAFEGDVVVQASVDGITYTDITGTSTTYLGITAEDVINVVGFYNFIRFQFTTTAGTIDRILVR